MLIAAFADTDAKNHADQTPMDVANPNVLKFFEELQKNNKRTIKREAATQIYDNDNDLPPKIVCMKMKPNKRNIDDFLKTPSEPRESFQINALPTDGILMSAVLSSRAEQMADTNNFKIIIEILIQC